MDKIGVIGYKGEVGSAIYDLCKEVYDDVVGVDVDSEGNLEVTSYHWFNKINIMHICIPYTPLFIDIVDEYCLNAKPKLLIINSTVPVGTTNALYYGSRNDGHPPHIVHSPIRGQHDNLISDIKRYTKWIGSITPHSGILARDHFKKLGLKTKNVADPKTTELIKLLDTTHYGMNIFYAQLTNRMCKAWNIEHELLREFGSETQKFYGLRPDCFPGIIEGNCVMQNIELLSKLYLHDLWGMIKESNELRKKEKTESAPPPIRKGVSLGGKM